MHHNHFPVEQGGPGGQRSSWIVLDYEVFEDQFYLICQDNRGGIKVIGTSTNNFQIFEQPNIKNRILAHAQSREKRKAEMDNAGSIERAARGQKLQVAPEPTYPSSPVQVKVNLHPGNHAEFMEVMDWLRTEFGAKKSSSGSSLEEMDPAGLQDFSPEQTPDGSSDQPKSE